MDFLTLPLPKSIEKLLYYGFFKQAETEINDLFKKFYIPESLKKRLEFELFRITILKKSYPYNKEKAFEIFKDTFRDATKNDFDFLLKNGLIDFRYINDEVKFQERFHYNLSFSDEKYRKKMKTNKIRQQVDELLKDTILKMIDSRLTAKYYVRAKISIRRKEPKNKNVSVWLPLPIEEFQQQDVKILSSSHEYESSNSKGQNTVYMEGKDTDTFWIEFSYVISNIVKKKTEFNNPVIDDDLSEKSPHILFTPYLKEISDTILEGIDRSNDFEVAKKLYDFITFEVDYSYVLPYAMYDNIPEYLTTTFKGDCGFQALTFLLRYAE